MICDPYRTPNRLISFEPVLGQIKNIDLTGIKWAIVGELHGGDAAEHPQDTGPRRMNSRNLRPSEGGWLGIVHEAMGRAVGPEENQRSRARRRGMERVSVRSPCFNADATTATATRSATGNNAGTGSGR